MRTMQPSAHPSVVHLDTDRGMCTGFVVKKGRVATAAHCFGYPKQTESEGTATFEDGRKAPFVLMKIGDGNGAQDVAIVSVDTKDIPVLTLQKEKEWARDFCFFVGFGGGYWGKNQMPCFNDKIIQEKGQPVSIILGDIIPGDSGGPVLGRNNVVVGLVFAFGYGRTGLGFAVPSWTVQKFLDEADRKVVY